MTKDNPFQSALIVFQNPVEGRQAAYDDWYTNVHIRDAMRLDCALGVQRFIVADDQPVLDGKRVQPAYWAHTIYEWDSTERSAEDHNNLAGTPAMEISRDGDFDGLRDYYYRPAWLSHGWDSDQGFRRGTDILTVLLVPKPGMEDAFIAWFRDAHAPATLDLSGFASAALFTLHEEQSLPGQFRFTMVAVYGLSDRAKALSAWAARHDARDPLDLSAETAELEQGCWQPRTPRLQVADVLDPTPEAAAAEQRARDVYEDRFLTRENIINLLTYGDPYAVVPAA
jgi:hypothetical protein